MKSVISPPQHRHKGVRRHFHRAHHDQAALAALLSFEQFFFLRLKLPP
jgi:hypothetical protein